MFFSADCVAGAVSEGRAEMHGVLARERLDCLTGLRKRYLVCTVRFPRGKRLKATRQQAHVAVSCILLKPGYLFSHLLNISQRTSEPRVFDADASAAHDAAEAAFFTQPSNSLSVTLPAFRACRVYLDVIE